jgi:transposase
MTLRVRDLREGEAEELARMTRSRMLGAGLVCRAQIVQHAVEGLSAPQIATRLDVCKATVRFWLKRFNARGLPGLEEAMRSGRPPTYTAEEHSAVIAAALSRPVDLDLPFACWTLDRLVTYLSEKGVGMKRSRISEILLAKGLKWRQEETWFGARVDPDLERKRGLLSTSTLPHRTTVLSSVLTKWDRRPPRVTPADASSSRPGRGRTGPNRKSTMAAAT